MKEHMTKNAFKKFRKLSPQIGNVQKINKKKLLLIVLPIIASLFIKLYVSNSAAGEGFQLAQLEKQIEETRRQNKLLEEEIATADSLQRIETEAESLGMKKPTSIVYAQDSLVGSKVTKTAFADNLAN